MLGYMAKDKFRRMNEGQWEPAYPLGGNVEGGSYALQLQYQERESGPPRKDSGRARCNVHEAIHIVNGEE